MLHWDDFEIDLSRPARRAVVLAEEDPRTAWLTRHRGQLTDLADALREAADRFRVDQRPWLDELRADVHDEVITAGTVHVLGLATDEVRTARAVVELRPTHNVHRAVLAADALRCEYSAAGCGAHWAWPPPRPGVPAIVGGIKRGRDAVDDPQRWRLPAAEDADPRDVLAFLRQWDTPNRRVRAGEAVAALALASAVWWSDRANEKYWARAGIRRGVMLRQIGSQHGPASRQGVRDWRDRLEALTEIQRLDESFTRDQRQAAADNGDADQALLGEHRGELERMAASVLAGAQAMQLPDEDREFLDELASEHAPGLTIRSLPVLRLAIDEITEVLAARSGDQAEDDEDDALPAIDEPTSDPATLLTDQQRDDLDAALLHAEELGVYPRRQPQAVR